MTTGLLTTEALRKKFKNNFNLCNFAINIGRNMVLSGDSSNLGQVLEAVSRRIDETSSEDFTVPNM
ncbi:MAG: hypothetical protein HY861_02320 [Chlamydiia bacterium]|nr:hypothetical protein [Chlamydiia bacterium]